MILIISHQEDVHTTNVCKELDKLNEKYFLLDISKLTEHMFIRGEFLNSSPNDLALIDKDMNEIPLNSVKSIWWRRPQNIIISPTIRNIDYRIFAVNEWYTALQGFWHSLNCYWINDLTSEFRFSHKPFQLTFAKIIGLLIPDTLITNNPDEVLKFVKKYPNQIIYKAFSATMQSWRETRPLREEFLRLIDSVKYAPVIFQEYIDNALDLRIIVIGDNVFAAEAIPVEGYDYDWRSHMDKLKWKIHKLPVEIEDKIRRYVKEAGLVYGAIDMKLKDEKYIFLEINPVGQFLFVEIDTKLPITKTLAEHLSRGY
jgi:glutathione synthase/RimK-type ligase-like ATP-grasp enzyme